MNENGDNRALPTLPAAGAWVTAVLTILLTAAGAYIPLFSPLTIPLTGALAAGMILLSRSVLSVIAPLAAAVLGACIAQSSAAAVLCFLFLPIGFAAAFAVFMRMSRMTAVTVSACAAAFVGTISIASAILGSGLTPYAFFQSLKTKIVLWLTSHTVLTETGARMPILTEESANALVSYFTVLAPSILICSLFLLAYVSTGLLWKLICLLGAENDFFPHEWHLMPGRITAAVYLIAQPITFLCAILPDTRAFYYGFYNVSLVFMFPLALLGISTVFRQFRYAKSLGGASRAAIAAIVLMCAAAGLYWLLTFAAFYGIYIVFRVTGPTPTAS